VKKRTIIILKHNVITIIISFNKTHGNGRHTTINNSYNNSLPTPAFHE